MTVRKFITAIILFLSLTGAKAQIPAIELMADRDAIKIPFTYYYNFIIVDVKLGGMLPMRLILDTGAENTLIFDKSYVDFIGTEYEREINILGSDFSSEVTALIARRVPFSIHRIGHTHSDIFVLNENLYHLEHFIGTEINGILGSNVFNGLVMTIDYDREYIKIERPDRFKAPKNAYALPFELQNGKPYITAFSQCGYNEGDSLTYLVDSGAGISTMLHTNTNPSINLPENIISGNLGSGLGGFITGFIGRMELIRIGPYEFKNLLSTFQELDTVLYQRADIKRNGIIGNQILSRFDITLNYATKTIYLVPNASYNEEFQVDRSGIILIASGPNLNDYFIQDLLPNSPAALAGLLAGDEILTINGIHVSLFSMGWLARRFQGKVGKNICLKIRRDGKKMRKEMTLRDLI
ncbi:MAG: PDZ domain-containing protein [Saprospiraceae bacterium]|nr:PDZ domain-containing protein [Saprospiraceae bacterium]